MLVSSFQVHLQVGLLSHWSTVNIFTIIKIIFMAIILLHLQHIGRFSSWPLGQSRWKSQRSRVFETHAPLKYWIKTGWWWWQIIGRWCLALELMCCLTGWWWWRWWWCIMHHRWWWWCWWQDAPWTDVLFDWMALEGLVSGNWEAVYQLVASIIIIDININIIIMSCSSSILNTRSLYSILLSIDRCTSMSSMAKKDLRLSLRPDHKRL